MSDWPRYPIPSIPGWNNAATAVTFDVTYNDATDVLTIVASQPVFTTVDQIDKGIVEDGNTVQIPSGQFSVDSTTTITIPVFSTQDANPAPFTLDQLDFWSDFAGNDLIGTWTGNVLIDPAPTFATTIDSAIAFYVNSTSSSAFGGVNPSEIDTALAMPGAEVSLSGSDATATGLRFTTTTGDVDVLYADDPSHFHPNFGTDAGTWYAWSEDLYGRTVTALTLLDAGGPMTAPYVLPTPILLYSVKLGGITSPADDTLLIEFDPPLATPPDQINFGDLNTGGTYDWTGGPYLPTSPQVVEWTTSRVLITDPVKFTSGNIPTANLFQILANDGNFAAYSSQVKPIVDYHAVSDTCEVNLQPGWGPTGGAVVSTIDWTGRDQSTPGGGGVASGTFVAGVDYSQAGDQLVISSDAIAASGAGQFTQLQLKVAGVVKATWDGYEPLT